MSQQTILLIFVGLWCVASTVGSFAIARAMARSSWNAPLAAFPSRESAPGDGPSDSRRFQSFRAGLVNLGWSVHVTTDRRYLHLTPAGPGRWLGLRSASIPWDKIEVAGPALPTPARATKLKIGRQTIDGPKWIAQRYRDVVEPR